MIRRIQIHGYKSLQNFEVSLSPLTIIFGPNSTGKSNFMDALQLLSQVSCSRTLKDAFNPPYRGRPIESFSFPENGIEGLLEKDHISFSFKVDVELSNSVITKINKDIAEMRRGIESRIDRKKTVNIIREKYLRYELEVELMPRQGFLRVKNERLCALKSNLQEKESRNAFLEKTENRLSLRMEGQSHPTYYDTGLDHTILSLPLYPPHYPHLTAIRKEFESWKFFYFEPRERMRAPNPTKETLHMGMMGEELASYLNTIKGKNIQHFNAINKAMRQIIPTIDRLDTEINKKTGEVELLIYENGVPIPARLVSEGTLRIIGLLSIAGGDQNPSLICLEEPENGIHPRRINLIAQYLTNISETNCQIIATTHSPILPDMIENNHLFVCKREQGVTTIIPFTEIGLFREQGIKKALNDEILTSDLIMRGDLDV